MGQTRKIFCSTYSVSDLMEAATMCLEQIQSHKILILKPTECQALNI